MTPQSASSGPTSKNFRLRRQESACGTAPTGRRVPTGTRRRCAFQYSTRNTSAPMGGPIFFKACGAGKGQGRKKGKPKEGSCNDEHQHCWFVRSSSEPVSERPTCSRARTSRVDSNSRRAARREAQHSTRSTTSSKARASSRAVSTYAGAAVVSGSSCRSHLLLDPKIFGLWRCDLGPETRNFLGTRHAEKNGRVDDLYKVYEVEERYNCC